jgi:hypothetical protein
VGFFVEVSGVKFPISQSSSLLLLELLADGLGAGACGVEEAEN